MGHGVNYQSQSKEKNVSKGHSIIISASVCWWIALVSIPRNAIFTCFGQINSHSVNRWTLINSINKRNYNINCVPKFGQFECIVRIIFQDIHVQYHIQSSWIRPKWYCVGLMLRSHPTERPMVWVDVSTAQLHQFIANTLSRTQHYENTPCRWSGDLSQHGFNRQALSVPKHKYSAVHEVQTCSMCTYIYLGRKNILHVRVQKIGHGIFQPNLASYCTSL